MGRLSADEDMDKETRGRLLGRLTRLLSASARRAGVTGVAGGRWLSDMFAYVAPRIPVRDLETLRAHHNGHLGEQLADDLVRVAANGTTAVGAAGGALAAVEFVAPPLLLSVPAQLVAETLVVAAIEVKLIAELHEVYGIQVPGGGSSRAAVFLTSWAKQRGVNPMTGGMTVALGTAAKQALRRRLLRMLGRHLTTLGPFLTGAIAGGTLNRTFTKRLAESVRKDLRRHVGPPIGLAERPRLGPAD
ncbi:hypothetical protein HKK74_05805 [Actinomadura alba]|uniref:EcsC protein family protein n=1 Tax=Actinomadura alba TaxID=406431 RepID=A0ABR7LKI3_9ACTN|nr:hypothetical protein [Actinomadura alba]